MLNPVAKKWVEALRSGKYKQGFGQLKNRQNEYCCLGVLCDLAEKEGMDFGEEWVSDGHYGWRAGLKVGLIPASVKEWVGLENSTSSYLEDTHNHTGSSLAAANDARRTFSEIADIIESEPKGLFVQGEQ